MGNPSLEAMAMKAAEHFTRAIALEEIAQIAGSQLRGELAKKVGEELLDLAADAKLAATNTVREHFHLPHAVKRETYK